MVRSRGQIGLYRGGALRPWSWDGYGPPVPAGDVVELLTPPSIAASIAAGYRPLVHPTAVDQDAKSGWLDRTASLRPLGSSQSS
jgi:hypothetical protein